MVPKYSSSRENYLKAIFHLQEIHGTVTTNDVASEMQTRPASVTDMLKKLKAQKLLLYERYKGFKLNTEGRKVAPADHSQTPVMGVFSGRKAAFWLG